jgi:sulfotransferase family protein
MNIDFTLDSILNDVKKKTNLEDFGNDSFIEGLSVLVNSCKNEARLNEIGCQAIEAIISQHAINRLKVQDWITRHPEILDEKIERPLFVAGLFRTGTTFLQTLLSLDPARRALHYWEADRPCPPPELIYSLTDSRIRTTHKTTQMIELLKPEYQIIYPIYAGGFAECQVLLANEFKSSLFLSMMRAPTYSDWLLNCDMNLAYAYHKKLLQLLQWRSPNESWILKAPMHIYNLNALLNQYPDAQIVFTHRDPQKIVPSFASMVSTLYSVFSDEIDGYEIANWASGLLACGVERAMKERKSLNPETFYDLQFKDLIADPIGSVKCIYEYFGHKMSVGHERRMKVYIRDNPHGKHGFHKYSIENFNVDPEDIRERFKNYQDQFDIPIEGK